MNLILAAGFLETIFPEKNSEQETIFLKLVVSALLALVVAFTFNRLVGKSIPFLARYFTPEDKSKKASERLLDTRRTETLLEVAAAISRVLVVAFCLYVAWRIVNPTSTPIALIGASTFFIVLGAATIGPLLRDVTTGTSMIAEKWYNVGDHIVVDPFWELSGVVEKVNLRSTKLRTLAGEEVWIHNQHIQAVRVTKYGVRRISVDTFVSDPKKGRELISSVLKTMPVGPTMITKPMKIVEEEQLGSLWRITAEGEATLGREWLIESFVVDAIKQSDGENPEKCIIHGPIVRYSDKLAEKRFAAAPPKARS